MRARIQSTWLLARVALILAFMVAEFGMLRHWWPSATWVEGIGFLWLGGYYQSKIGPACRNSPFLQGVMDQRGRLLADYWGVRVVAMSAILVLVIPELLGLAMIWPKAAFIRDGLGLTLIVWLASLGAASMIAGMIATALRDFAIKTERLARERNPVADE